MTMRSGTPMRRPQGLKSLHQRATSYSEIEPSPIRDELLQHSRYIRDYLAPMLESTSELPASELGLLRNIMNRLGSLPVTMALLRHSRIEKALLTIADPDAKGWPLGIVEQAKYLLQKWEIGLGQSLSHIKNTLLKPGGRLEGLRPVTVGLAINVKEDADYRWATLHPGTPERAFEAGHAGFDVGAWFLNPPSAALAGIVAFPTPQNRSSITTCPVTQHATAIVIYHGEERSLPPYKDGYLISYLPPTVVPRASIHSMMKTFTSTSRPKVVRLLRSWTAQSVLAPRKGLRYDGLYRILGHGIKLDEKGTWNYSFTLGRVGSGADVLVNEDVYPPIGQGQVDFAELGQPQPSLNSLSGIPTRDMCDDWNDYADLVERNFGIYDWGEKGTSHAPASTDDAEPSEERKERTESWDSGYLSIYNQDSQTSTLPRESREGQTSGEHFPGGERKQAAQNVEKTIESFIQAPEGGVEWSSSVIGAKLPALSGSVLPLSAISLHSASTATLKALTTTTTAIAALGEAAVAETHPEHRETGSPVPSPPFLAPRDRTDDQGTATEGSTSSRPKSTTPPPLPAVPVRSPARPSRDSLAVENPPSSAAAATVSAATDFPAMADVAARSRLRSRSGTTSAGPEPVLHQVGGMSGARRRQQREVVARRLDDEEEATADTTSLTALGAEVVVADRGVPARRADAHGAAAAAATTAATNTTNAIESDKPRASVPGPRVRALLGVGATTGVWRKKFGFGGSSGSS